MKHNHHWLFIEPYVHLIHRKESVLFYNTMNHKVLEYHGSHVIYLLAGEILDPSNGYVIPLSNDQLEHPEVSKFITQLRKTFMGDLLDPAWSEEKPVNILPEPFVKHGFRKTEDGKTPSVDELDPRDYIQGLTLYLNSGPQAVSVGYPGACHQFGFPGIESEEIQFMDLSLFRKIINDINNYTPTLIHVSGSDILAHPGLDDVIDHLASSPFQKKYHLAAYNWKDELVSKVITQKRSTLALYITFPTHPDILAACLSALPEDKFLKKVEFNFVIRDTEELQMSLEIIQILDLENVFFKPYFDGQNLNFFIENVFVSREEILAANPNQQQLFSRITINETDFGKFAITPMGEVFANLNDSPVGDATQQSFVHLVHLELDRGISWSRTRGKVTPCNDCLYQFLCPPVSSYEIYMNRFNFCDVVPNTPKS